MSSCSYIGWRVQSDQKRWRSLIQAGLQDSKIQLLVDGEAVTMLAGGHEEGETDKELLPLLSTYTVADGVDDGVLETVATSDIGADLPPTILNAQFALGQVVMTQGVSALVETGFDALAYLQRHATCDWGDLDTEDVAQNNAALKAGNRLFSSYATPQGKLWIITEAGRHATTLLKPDEY